MSVPVDDDRPGAEHRPPPADPNGSPAYARSGGRRLPRTLWASIAGEMLRLLLLTAAALVVVIAFAASVKPLADGDIGPASVVVLMGVLSVPMLQFALPFAGGFAATLAYHRFAADREFTAAAAGGLSHRAILAPAAIIGLVLALAVGVLSNTAIPTFLRTAERIVTQDVSRLITAPLSRNQTLVINDWQVRAGRVTDLEPREGSRFFDHIVLEDALIARIDEDSPRDPAYIAAERIDLFLTTAEGPAGDAAVDVFLRLADASGEGFEGLYRLDRFFYEFEDPIRVPNAFSNDPKFLSLAELRAVRAEPRRFEKVEKWVRRLAALLAQQRHLTAISQRVDAGLPVRLTRGDETFSVLGGRSIVSPDAITILGAGGARAEATEREGPGPPGPVVVEHAREDGSLVRHDATRAELLFDEDMSLAGLLGFIQGVDDVPRTLFLKLRMTDVITTSIPATGPPSEQSELTFGGVVFPDAGEVTETALPLDGLLASARERASAASTLAPAIRDAADKVETEARELRREIDSKIHERFAYMVAAGLMVITGAVMALRLREALPLPVYLWSFAPALAAVVTISSGQTVVYEHGAVGLVVLWGGVVALAAFTFGQYRVISRH